MFQDDGRASGSISGQWGKLYGQGNMNCWNSPNIPGIKTEPRETSSPPYRVFRTAAEVMAAYQPISRSIVYPQNTPSIYSAASTLVAQTRGNQQYNGANTMDANNVTPHVYNAFGQQTQMPQQPYHNNTFGGAGATNWDTEFHAGPAAGNSNMNNLNNPNTLSMHNHLALPNTAGGPGNTTKGSGAAWNVTPSNFHPQNLLPAQHPQLQYHQQQQTANNNLVTSSNNGGLANAATNVAAADNGNNTNNGEHGLSNLLNFDSEQLIRINSEDQQMLRLDSEDLQISNLSIST